MKLNPLICTDIEDEEFDLLYSGVHNDYQYARRRTAFVRRAKDIHDFTIDEYMELCEFFDFKCCRCKCDVIGGVPTKDHIVSVTSGGSSHIWNIQPLCRGCNSSKSNLSYYSYKDDDERLPEKFSFTKNLYI